MEFITSTKVLLYLYTVESGILGKSFMVMSKSTLMVMF